MLPFFYLKLLFQLILTCNRVSTVLYYDLWSFFKHLYFNNYYIKREQKKLAFQWLNFKVATNKRIIPVWQSYYESWFYSSYINKRVIQFVGTVHTKKITQISKLYFLSLTLIIFFLIDYYFKNSMYSIMFVFVHNFFLLNIFET